jgi:outer membrane immunogenic protein
MKKLSGILGLTLASVVALASANAADLNHGYKDGPAYVGVNWSGLYLGVNGGYGWADSDYMKPEGAFGGGQIGYNVQRGNLVFGLEADFQGSGIGESKSYFLGSDKSQLDWFGTVRARAGFTVDRALVYATGGYAYGRVVNSYSNILFSGSDAETQGGWVAGGGVEFKMAPNWSVKSEYQYLDLDASDSHGAGQLGWGSGTRSQIGTARVGLNYFVGGGYEPLK